MANRTAYPGAPPFGVWDHLPVEGGGEGGGEVPPTPPPPPPPSFGAAPTDGVKVLRPTHPPPMPSQRVAAQRQGACGPSTVSRQAPFATAAEGPTLSRSSIAHASGTPRAAAEPPASPARFAGQGSFARTPSQTCRLGGLTVPVTPNAVAPGAAGQPSAERGHTLPGSLPSMQPDCHPRAHTWGNPSGASDAAGRGTCGLSAQQRKYGGQISAMGGLG